MGVGGRRMEENRHGVEFARKFRSAAQAVFQPPPCQLHPVAAF